MELPYDLVVSTFHACFDCNRRVYPGSRDRGYNCGRAILWIHTLAMCKSGEFASTFRSQPLNTRPQLPTLASHVLLHLSWANRWTALNFEEIVWSGPETIPLAAMLNRLLTCILLGSPMGEEALKVQGKSCNTCFRPSSCSQYFSAIAWNRSCINYPMQLFQPSISPNPEANLPKMCYPT